MKRNRRTKYERKRRSTPVDDPARPPFQRAQHDEIVLGERVVFHEDGTAERTFGARVMTARIFDRYLRNQLISPRQWAAADRFYEDHYLASTPPRLVANLECAGVGGGYGDHPVPRREEARRSRDSALMALPRVLRGFTVAVVIDDKAASVLCTERGEKAAKIAGLTMLRIALDCLVDHYQIAENVKI